MSFESFSQVKLPFYDFGRSRLNLLSGKIGLVDGGSENFGDLNHSTKWGTDLHVNQSTTITGGLEICGFSELLQFLE